MIVDNKFSERLIELMIEKGLNQKQLAVQTGLSNQAISAWVTKTREPGLQSLLVLADYFQCSIDVLVGRDEY